MGIIGYPSANVWAWFPWKESFVVAPTICMVLNVILACALSQITSDADRHSELLDLGLLAINLVSTAAISIITLTFTLTVLIVQMAAQTYSPRLLDQFVKDPVAKVVISVNLGAYAYCYTMTYFIDTGGTEHVPEVPYVAIHMMSVHMALVLVTFVNYIHFFVNSFRIEKILARALESSLGASKALNSQVATEDELLALPDVPNNSYKVTADKSGYVSRYQLADLVPIAEKLDICLRYNRYVGEFIIQGTILCYVWDAKTRENDLSLAERVLALVNSNNTGRGRTTRSRPSKRLATSVLEAEEDNNKSTWMGHVVEDELRFFAAQGVCISKKRSGDLDVTLGIQQLSDTAVRMLSPAVNDPNTAVQCMDVLSNLFVTLGNTDLSNLSARDAGGNVRLCAPRRSFAFLLAMLDSIRHYGETDLVVCRRGLCLFGDLGASLTRARRLDRVPAVFAQLEQWMLVCEKNFGGPELASAQELYEYLLQNIADADHLTIKKGECAGTDLQALDITHKDDTSQGRQILSMREATAKANRRNTVKDFLRRSLPPSMFLETPEDEEQFGKDELKSTHYEAAQTDDHKS